MLRTHFRSLPFEGTAGQVRLTSPRNGGSELLCTHALESFDPAVFFVETPSLLLCLFTRHVWEQVTHKRLFGMETPQIVLRTLDHQLQANQGVPKRLLQGLQKLCRSLIDTASLPLVTQVTGNREHTLFTDELQM